jgi:hypothetical protein
MQIDHFFELASGKLFVIIGNDITMVFGCF